MDNKNNLTKKNVPQKPTANKSPNLGEYVVHNPTYTASATDNEFSKSYTNKNVAVKNEDNLKQTNINDLNSEKQIYEKLISQNKKPQKGKKRKIKKQHTLYAIFGIISDILVYPVIVISLISSFAMFTSKKENKVPPVFGFSFVQILSGSMTNDNFEVKEIVIINQLVKNEVNNGDIIAFYYPNKSLYEGKVLTEADSIVSRDKTSVTYLKDGESYTVDKTDAEYAVTTGSITKDASIYFHRIVGVFIDEDGTIYFQTKGSSNNSPDSFYIREDLVVGRYVNTPKFLRSAFSFCSTPLGMVILVVVPLSILVLLEMLSVIEQFENLFIEKNVLKLKTRFDDTDAIKANIAMELRNCDKVYLYDLVDAKDKQALYDMQWGYLDNLKLNKKTQKYLDNVKESLKLYNNENSLKYWTFWINSAANKREKMAYQNRKIKAFEIKYTAADIINNMKEDSKLF